MEETGKTRRKNWLVTALCVVPLLLFVLYLAFAGPIVVELLLAEGRAALRQGWDPTSGETCPCDFGSEAMRWIPDKIGNKWNWYRWYFQDHVSDRWLSESPIWAIHTGRITLEQARQQLGVVEAPGNIQEKESNKVSDATSGFAAEPSAHQD